MPAYNRRNSAFSITYNGQRANGLYALAERVGKAVSRFGTAEQKARAGLRRRMEPVTAREIRKHINVPRRALTGTLRVQERLRRDGDALSLWASARRIPLIEFNGRWGGRKTLGATAQVFKGQTDTHRGAFIATVQGLRAIRVRSYAGGGKRVGRGPLRMLYGPSPLYMLRPTDIPDRLTNVARTISRSVIAELQAFYIAELRRLYRIDIGRAR